MAHNEQETLANIDNTSILSFEEALDSPEGLDLNLWEDQPPSTTTTKSPAEESIPEMIETVTVLESADDITECTNSKGLLPNVNDVLLGRGGRNNKWSGNERLRALARDYGHHYSSAGKSNKPAIAAKLVVEMQHLTPPGRFLKQDPKSREWFQVSEDVAREKASQCLRDVVSAHNKRVQSQLCSGGMFGSSLRTSTSAPSVSGYVPPAYTSGLPNATFLPPQQQQQHQQQQNRVVVLPANTPLNGVVVLQQQPNSNDLTILQPQQHPSNGITILRAAEPDSLHQYNSMPMHGGACGGGGMGGYKVVRVDDDDLYHHHHHTGSVWATPEMPQHARPDFKYARYNKRDAYSYYPRPVAAKRSRIMIPPSA